MIAYHMYMVRPFLDANRLLISVLAMMQ